MIVVIDVGNTHTVLGIYRDDLLLDNWRISTSTHRTRDEYIILLEGFLRSLDADRREVSGMMISCVVPPVLNELLGLASKYFHFDEDFCPLAPYDISITQSLLLVVMG